eukprot:COSAG01_NODE_3975_length_5476_cov_11.325646_7_plen_70_part_01
MGLYFTELQRLNPALAAVYSKEMFYEDWKIGCLQFLVGVLPLAAGAFADKTDDRMANLWMYAVNRYAMAM